MSNPVNLFFCQRYPIWQIFEALFIIINLGAINKKYMCNPAICKNCRFFQPEGYYHGKCDRMNVAVKGEWRACQLSLLAFGAVVPSV
jgi:hypothetical protein